MLLRLERTADRGQIHELHSLAFGQGSAGDHTPEARLVDQLRADGDLVPGLSIVAERAGEIVGHVVCSRGVLAGESIPGLGPLGVLPSAQRSGVGTALMHAVIAAADALGERAILLLGDPAFYRRFGFVPASSRGVHAVEPQWGANFQIRVLTTWSDELAGTYAYAKAFDRLE